MWNTPKGSVEVAIKTLKGSATEDEELKFLQEAAINGQFHHPNVVQLCGVVTVGQPVRLLHTDLLNVFSYRSITSLGRFVCLSICAI